MAVLCKNVTNIDQFNDKFVNGYEYEVLRGFHTLVAKNQLREEHPENPFLRNCGRDTFGLD